MTDLEYLQNYLALMDLASTKGPGGLRPYENWDEEDDCSYEETHPLFDSLEALNKEALEGGVTPSLIRKEFILQDALMNTNAWYSSSINCMPPSYRTWP